MTNTPTGYSKQCRTCNAPETVQRFITEQHKELGPKYTEISRRLLASHPAYSVGPDALTTHIQKHAQLSASVPTVTPLLGVVNPPVTPPKGWEAKVELDGDSGEVTTTPQTDDTISDFSEILVGFGIDPNEFEIDGKVRLSKWQVFDGTWRTSYKF